MKINFTISILLLSGYVSGQQPVAKILNEGDRFYKQEQYAQAAETYSKVLITDKSNEKAKFNQANALYKQDKKMDAVQLYADIATNTVNTKLRSNSWYNKGVILTDQKNLEGSIESYKHALRNDPSDRDARENLQKALLELKKRKEENKNQQQQDKKNQQQKNQSSSKMQPKEAEQRLRLLQQKEKEVQERVQKQKRKTGGSQGKDW